MRRCAVLLLLAAVFALPSLAFADAMEWPVHPDDDEIVLDSFRDIMEVTSTTWVALVTDYPFMTFTPDGYWEDDATWSNDEDFAEAEHKWVPPCDNNTNGIPDVIEFAVLAEIFEDTGHPLHTELHEAFKANMTQIETDLGALQNQLAPVFKYIMAAYATLGDGDYQSQVINSVRYGWGFEGSWGVLAVAVYDMDDYGGLWRPAEGSAPDTANYQRKASLVAACGDVDGDGVTNLGEFYGNGGVYTGAALDPFLDPPDDDLTNSMAAEAAYVAAALDTGTTTDGGDPAEVCSGESSGGWAWGENIWYYPENGYVYVAGPNMPWTPGQYWAQNLFTIGSEKAAVVGNLASIDSEGLQNWLVANVLTVVDETMWTGGNDKGAEGNWKWVATDVQFWSGAADGSAVGGAYENWNDDEPNDSSGEDCMEIRKEGGWNDQGDDSSRPVLIEFSNEGAGYADSNGNGFPDWWETYLPAPAGVHAEFSAVPTSGDMPLTVDFTDESTIDAEGYAITGWEWDFGDGSPVSNDQNPSHVYNATEDPRSTYTVSLTVTATKTGEDDLTNTKTATITVNYVCEWALDINDQAAVVAADPAGVNAGFGTLVGATPYASWDIDADLLPDEAQLALLAYVACKPAHPLSASVGADLASNTAAWEALFPTGGLYDNSVFFAALAGLSAEMQTALGAAVGADLSGFALYGDAKAGETFSAEGDLDGDGLTNLEEYTQVMDTPTGTVAIFVDAATDPDNFWYGNPLLPVAGIVGLGLLAGSILAGAAFSLRKK